MDNIVRRLAGFGGTIPVVGRHLLEKSYGPIPLLGCGSAPEGTPERVLGTFVDRPIREALRHDQREVARLLCVEQGEGLRGDGGGFAPLAGQVRIRPVEDLDHRIDQTALLEAVNRAAVSSATSRLGLVERPQSPHGVSRLTSHVGVDLRVRARPADRVTQFSGDGKHRVAQLLGLQASRHEPSEVLVLGISSVKGVTIRVVARPPVGLRIQNHPMHSLHAPALVDEKLGQPVQQFRMRGLLAHLSEVVRIRRQAAPEVVLPDAIHKHASGQRVAWVRDPFG